MVEDVNDREYLLLKLLSKYQVKSSLSSRSPLIDS